MSNTEFVLKSHRLDLDLNDEETEYPASDVQWSYIQDNNSMNFANGWINFNNSNLVGNSSDKFFDLKNAYLQLPYGCVVSITNGSFGSSVKDGTGTFAHLPENAFSVAPKSDGQHLIDLVSAKIGGVSINRQSQYTNLMMTEDMKCQTMDHEKIFHEDASLDSADSYALHATLLESNNRTFPLYSSVGAVVARPTGFNFPSLRGGYSSAMFANETHLKRMMKQNFDNTNVTGNGSLFNTAGSFTEGSSLTSLQTGLMGVYDSNGVVVEPTGISTSGGATRITKLLFQFVANIPLASICDFYKTCPSVGSLANFELRLQSNASSNNSWSVTYETSPVIGAPVNNPKILLPTSLVANQSVGTTNPFMLSQCSWVNDVFAESFGQGLAISTASAVAPTISVNPFIGYYGKVPNLANQIVPVTSVCQQGCRIWIPQYNYTPLYTQPVLSSKNCKVIYKDFFVDTIPNVDSTLGPRQVSKLFVSNLSHVRNLYIIPFFAPSATTPNSVPVMRSLISSAPTTCSFCKMSQFQVQVGGVNILTESINSSNQFYENSMLQALARYDGNAFNSELVSGLVTKAMYNKCYGVVSLDIKRVQDQVQDDAMKSFLLNFRVDTRGVYDFIVLITYDNTVYIDRILGSVVSPEEATR